MAGHSFKYLRSYDPYFFSAFTAIFRTSIDTGGNIRANVKHVHFETNYRRLWPSDSLFQNLLSDFLFNSASQYIQDATVNRAILQNCCFWFGNTGADFVFNVLN
jgi:hypothetical protein